MRMRKACSSFISIVYEHRNITYGFLGIEPSNSILQSGKDIDPLFLWKRAKSRKVIRSNNHYVVISKCGLSLQRVITVFWLRIGRYGWISIRKVSDRPVMNSLA